MGVLVGARLLALALLEPPASDETEARPSPVVELSWTAPAECPDREAVLAEIVRLVGRPLGQDPTRTLNASGRIDRRPDGGYRLELELLLEGSHARRELDARSCDTLLVPAAVMVAVAVDPPTPDDTTQPLAVPEAPPPPPQPLGDAEEPTPPRRIADARDPQPTDPIPPRPTSAASGPRREPERPQAVLGVAGGMAIGVVPRVGASLEGGVGVLLPRIRIELEGVHLFRRRVFGPLADTGGELRITAARPAACARLGGPRVEVPLCGGVELGVLRAEGFGISDPTIQRHSWLAILAASGLAVRLRPWLALRIRAGMALSLLRREFTLLGASVATTGVVDGRLGLGLEVRLP
jgi:hypothetical protein